VVQPGWCGPSEPAWHALSRRSVGASYATGPGARPSGRISNLRLFAIRRQKGEESLVPARWWNRTDPEKGPATWSSVRLTSTRIAAILLAGICLVATAVTGSGACRRRHDQLETKHSGPPTTKVPRERTGFRRDRERCSSRSTARRRGQAVDRWFKGRSPASASWFPVRQPPATIRSRDGPSPVGSPRRQPSCAHQLAQFRYVASRTGTNPYEERAEPDHPYRLVQAWTYRRGIVDSSPAW